jgi:hypothetical protein
MRMVYLDCETARFDPGFYRLLEAGRHQELLDLIATAPFLCWHYRRYGGRALAAQGRTDETIHYAEQSLGLNDGPLGHGPHLRGDPAGGWARRGGLSALRLHGQPGRVAPGHLPGNQEEVSGQATPHHP